MQDNISFTPHFSLREFIASRTARDHGINNTPSEEAVENLRALCVHTLEPQKLTKAFANGAYAALTRAQALSLE